MVTGLGVASVALAPEPGGVKVITPPSTGSAGLVETLATVIPSALAKAVLTVALCGVLPVTGVRVKPWDSKAPISQTVPCGRVMPR